MGVVETKLNAMGYRLSEAWKFPSPNRRGCVRVGNLLFVSGHGPYHPEMSVKAHGKVGLDISESEAYESARVTALMILATIKQEIGDLDRVTQVVRLFCMVNCTPDFAKMSQVMDGASDLFYALYGPQAGCHARSAVGMVSLPRSQSIEINGEFAVHA